MMVFVSQHEKISMRAPRFCVAYQAPHAVVAEASHAVAAEAPHVVSADRTHAVAADGNHAVAAGDGSHAVAADRRARACAEGKALRKRLNVFRTQAVRKNYKVSTRTPATLPLSPRVLNCPFSLPALIAQLTSSSVLVTIFRACGNGNYGVSQNEKGLHGCSLIQCRISRVSPPTTP